jgi:hypothetical protein
MVLTLRLHNINLEDCRSITYISFSLDVTFLPFKSKYLEGITRELIARFKGTWQRGGFSGVFAEIGSA